VTATASATPDPASLSAASLGAAASAAPSSERADAEAFTASATPGNSAYKIGPQDVLDVSVFKVTELSKSVQVADSGSINLPLVGEVPAAGLTAQDVERDLTKRLGAKYLQSPQVTVFVKEYNSQRVTIEGAVKKPGVYPVRGKTSLLQSIALAEGLDEAAQDEIVVFRQVNGKRVGGKFDVAAIRAGSAEDPAIRNGDVIVVGHSGMKAAWQNFLKAIPAAASVAMFF
jgi:polysaccharide export outer membrane protein